MSPLNKTLITLAIIGTSSAVIASESHGYITESGIKITPLFDIKLERNDNVGRYSKAEQPLTSNVLVIKPGIVLDSDRNGNQYKVAYQLISGTYSDSDDDDYLDHRFTTNNFVKINRRSGIRFNYSYLNLHEERGTGILAGDTLSTIAKEPVEYDLHNVNTTYIYGAEEAKGRLETTLKYQSKTYNNYRNIASPEFSTLSTKYKDYRDFGGAIAFYYDLRPATELLFDINLTDRRYKLGDPKTGQSQDNVDAYYLIGSKWNVTGKTTGMLRLGLQNKDYDYSGKKDFTGFSWDLNFNWKPLSYSAVYVSASQRAEDPQQGTNYIDKTRFDIAWQHYWMTHFYSRIGLNFIKEDYSESKRTDDLLESTLVFGYQLRDYAEIQAGWQYEDNSSSFESNTYTQNVWYLSTNFIF
ncbi:outer membrane beta-barrel protein [Vibrio alfacsensis]|uniref:outer membrane beta-barrel protein n=1 Tax=Vibrio alfacsensis TaxID=1074311 RepID=UPI001BEDFA2F|nr:outer membrane beta-barrel protein [Vibrio alfacsensis]BCN25942.1 capsular polysaccharide biosynthesis protein [Vibrio alfacsensis]